MSAAAVHSCVNIFKLVIPACRQLRIYYFYIECDSFPDGCPPGTLEDCRVRTFGLPSWIVVV